jgi:hypothetical protein
VIHHINWYAKWSLGPSLTRRLSSKRSVSRVASFQRAVSIPLYDEEIVRIKVAELI